MNGEWKARYLNIGIGPFDGAGWYATRSTPFTRSHSTVLSLIGPFATEAEAQAVCDQKNGADEPIILRAVPPTELKT